MREPSAQAVLGRDPCRDREAAAHGSLRRRRPARVVGRTLADVGRYLLAFAVAAGRGAGRFWRSLSLIARRRLVAAVGAAALLLLLFAAVVPNLPCQLPGGDSCPPADDAEQLVPADALAYLHANLDPETDQYAAAAELGEQLPVLGGQLADRALALVPGAGGGRWTSTPDSSPGSAARRRSRCWRRAPGRPSGSSCSRSPTPTAPREYAASIAVGEVQTEEYEGVEVSVDQRDVATAQVDGFLVIGTEDGVAGGDRHRDRRRRCRVARRRRGRDRVRDELPDQRFAEALSADGIEALVAGTPERSGRWRRWSAPGASSGLAASLSAGDDELELAVRSALDPERATEPGFFAAFPAFEPSLAERLRPATARLPRRRRARPRRSPRCSPRPAPRLRGSPRASRTWSARCAASANVDLEARAARGARRRGGGGARAGPRRRRRAADRRFHTCCSLADGVDEDAPARRCRAQGRCRGSPATSAGAGVRPGARSTGCETSSLRLSPTVELTYAVFDGLAASPPTPPGSRRRRRRGRPRRARPLPARDRRLPRRGRAAGLPRPRRAGGHRRAGGPCRGPASTPPFAAELPPARGAWRSRSDRRRRARDRRPAAGRPGAGGRGDKPRCRPPATDPRPPPSV